MRRILALVCDIALLIAAVATLWSVSVGRGRVQPKSAAHQSFAVGQPLGTTDVDWSRARTNLVLVLNSKCRFCAASGPFYGKIAATAAGNSDIQLVALFPVDEGGVGQEFLRQLGLSGSEFVVRHQVLSSTPISFPTIVMVDQNGRVQKEWVGKLKPAEQGEVLATLGTRPL
jgi:hypothetical protein